MAGEIGGETELEGDAEDGGWLAPEAGHGAGALRAYCGPHAV